MTKINKKTKNNDIIGEEENPNEANKNHPQNSSEKTIDYRNIFLEDDEKLMGILKKGWLQNLTLENSLSHQFLLLSQKRLYYSGTSFGQLNGRKLGRMKVLKILPLNKIDSIQFGKVAHVWLVIVGIITLPLFGFGLILIILYFLSKRQTMVISTPTAPIEISLSLFGVDKTINFAKLLGKEMSIKK